MTRSVSPSTASEPPRRSITSRATSDAEVAWRLAGDHRGGDARRPATARARGPTRSRSPTPRRRGAPPRSRAPRGRGDGAGVGLDRLAVPDRQDPVVGRRRELERVGLGQRRARSGRPRSARRGRAGRSGRPSGSAASSIISTKRALPLVELAGADQRLREAVDRRERGAQVVAGERDEAGEVARRPRHRLTAAPARAARSWKRFSVPARSRRRFDAVQEDDGRAGDPA